jgi:hypothetical protein
VNEATRSIPKLETGSGIEWTIDCENRAGLNSKDLLITILSGHLDGGSGRVLTFIA